MHTVVERIEQKNIFKIFFFWQEKKEEDWLRQMSLDGWHLNKVGLFNYGFVKGEPKDVIYKFDYKPFRSEKIDDYITMFEDSGWECVARFAGWFYFRADAKKGISLELYNDNASRVRKYITLRWVLFIACVPIVYNLPNLLARIIRAFRTGIMDDILTQAFILNIVIPLTVFLIIVLGLLIYGVIRASITIRKMKLDIKE